jgi:hypothetical protein
MTDETDPAEVAARLQKLYEAGDKWVLLYVIEECVSAERPAPKWARDALWQAYGKARLGRVRSWNEVFGPPWHQGKKTKQQRSVQTWVKGVSVYLRIHHLSQYEGKSINAELFDQVAKEQRLSRATVIRLYGEVRDSGLVHDVTPSSVKTAYRERTKPRSNFRR